MKKVIRNLLIGNATFQEYPAIVIDSDAISEKVFIEMEGTKREVSASQWLLSLEPMVLGIWFSAAIPVITKKMKCVLHFNSHKEETVARQQLVFIDSITEKEGPLFLFEVQKSDVFHASKIRTLLIYQKYYKKPKSSFSQFKNLAAAFSYPRKVRLVSFLQDDYFNIFPMDLVGDIPNTDYFVFGLRNSNTTLDKIIATKKIVLAEFPAFYKKDIYKLSHHHASNPPNINSLPFNTTPSRLFDFPVPEWATNYKEIEIEKTLNLGSHMLLWGKSTNKVELNENTSDLYHIHFLHYLNAKDKYIIDS